ncbi:hypothetical protein SAMN05216360_10930 [Methylobacterium phyllostachyos]|uniref:Hemolysin n=1 Tax=Methylobacterium phyllostachyos TaxID=582672 RepID=A0A1H0C5J8_9HYPH|nr:DUF333 domain-containing protein [Methylobacterium phyllostachyos]SDN53142.1 hypothetical protein SAMN05216360_10930 [Methylobacterium phyllostachyos]
MVKPLVLLAVGAGLALPNAAHAIGNPASVFCATMGGRSVQAKLPDGGEVGLCDLPGRKIVEAWTLYRMLQGAKPAPNDNPFR